MAHLVHDQRGPKQHAQVRGERPRLRPLWVYDEDDWTLMRSLPTGSLICPESRCSSAFEVPQENTHGTRFLKNRRVGDACSHLPTRPDLGGGPMSAQHRWLQARLARILETLDFPAITEHAATNADVFVPGPGLAIEVQRWSSNFEKRTAARVNKGSPVLWLLTEDAKGRATQQALFSLPAARVKVHALGDDTRRLAPWDDRSLNRRARLSVFATVATLRADASLRTRPYDARAFLAEVLAGSRRWYPPGTPGLPDGRGLWVLEKDLEVAAKKGVERSRRELSTAASSASHTDVALQAAMLREGRSVAQAARRRLRRRPPRPLA
jgi:hypothetical protein